MRLKNNSALVMVDVQNDFCPGGNLPVPRGDEIVPLANQLQPYFDLIVATQDWHPVNHMSFASNNPTAKVGEVIDFNGISQVMWPNHCIQNSKGSELHPELETELISKIIYKGSNKDIDSYSAFYDNAHMRSTGLSEFLKSEKKSSIYLMGLATDYCVKYSCLDAINLGFEVILILDACRGIDLKKGDVENALKEMEKAGVKIITSKDILAKNFEFE